MFKYVNNLLGRYTKRAWTDRYYPFTLEGLTDTEIIWLNMFEEHEYLDLIRSFISYNEMINKNNITIADVTRRLMKEQSYRVK